MPAPWMVSATALACAARVEDASYVSWAHSIVVDPWAQVVCDLGTAAQTRVVSIDLDVVDAVRQQIPIGRA